MQDPCKDCPRRRVTAEYNCHSAGNCEEFDRFQAQQNEIKRRRMEENAAKEAIILSILSCAGRGAVKQI